MSIPRELSVRKGRLYQNPIRELEGMRKGKVEYRNVKVTGEIRLPGIEGRKVDMELRLRPGAAQNPYRKFALRFAQNEEYRTSLSFRPHESVLKIDRKFSGSRRAIVHQRRSLVRKEGEELKLRIILDLFSAEIFVNDGEQVLTMTMYTDLSASGISFFADGQAIMDITKYDLLTESETPQR